MNIIHNIGIAGNIGVGKTTLTKKLSNDLQLEPIYESVIDNPYLPDFYDNMDDGCLCSNLSLGLG